MERRLMKNEISNLANDCINCIRQDEDVIELLKAKGFGDDAVEVWYDIRRWIKSNRSADYVMLPIKWRIEIPASGVPVKVEDGTIKRTPVAPREPKTFGPQVSNEKPDDLAGFEAVAPKRRGRPPKDPNAPKKARKPREDLTAEEQIIKKAGPHFRILNVESEHFHYRLYGENLEISVKRGTNSITVSKDEIDELLKEVPKAYEMLMS